MTDIFQLAEDHFHAVAQPVNTTPYGEWEEPYQVMRSLMGSFSSVKDLIHCVQDWRVLPFGHRMGADPKQIADCLRVFRKEFPGKNFLKISDEPNSRPDTIQNIAGNYFSNMHLWHGWSWLAIQSRAKDVKDILEVGGGYGAFARLWLKYSKVDRYVIVDTPETLYFAEIYLRDYFGDKVGYFVDHDPGAQVLLIPVDRHEQYTRPSDIVINIGSLQEMTPDWVNHYMQWLDVYNTRYFYSLNYDAQPISNEWVPVFLQRDPSVISMTCKDSFLAALYEKNQ